jgi:hypothetical protein
MLRAYPAEPTVDAGGTLILHVATDRPRYGLRLERWGGGCRPVLEAGPFRGENAPAGRADRPWDWPRVTIPLPRDLSAGAYVVRATGEALTQRGERCGRSPDARAGTALVVVRAPSSARVLMNLPLFTYHAYNVADVDGTLGVDEGRCLYSGSPAVTLARPGGGTGGHPWDEVNVDVYDRRSPRQTFTHWDLPALDWFAREGIAVDVCTDLDLHRDPALLDRYAMLCTFGHDEYWTVPKRSAVERFADAGGAVAFFGGNTCWFRVRYDEATASIARDGRWSDDDPEDALTGLSFRRGGGKWCGARPPTGYRICDDAHPIIEEAGLRAGDVVGLGVSVVGYECDGVDPRFAPHGLATLGRAPLGHWNVANGSGEIFPGGHAAIVAFERGEGRIFNAGTTDWARALDHGDPGITAITRAVFRSFTTRRGKEPATSRRFL